MEWDLQYITMKYSVYAGCTVMDLYNIVISGINIVIMVQFSKCGMRMQTFNFYERKQRRWAITV